MRTLYIMIGLQASGKSTYAHQISERTKGLIVSTDEIRIKNPKMEENEVFKTFYSELSDILSTGQDAIADATNISVKSRRRLLSNVKNKDKVIAVMCNVPLEICKERLDQRNSTDYQPKIPTEAIDITVKRFEIPVLEEGIDEIYLTRDIAEEYTVDKITQLVKKQKEFRHHDTYHGDETIEDHIHNIIEYFQREGIDKKDAYLYDILYKTAWLHDIGKPYTAFEKESGFLAYYHHENIGSYMMISHMGQIMFDQLYNILVLCNFHMYPFRENWINKSKQFLYPYINTLTLFHEADQYRGNRND